MNWDAVVALVALVALVQPWGIAIWRRVTAPGRLDIYQGGWIVLGYTPWGPSIGLQGTLRSRNRDVFVHEMMVAVTRLSDQARHEFTWILSYSPVIPVDGSGAQHYEVPAGFLVSTGTPHRYAIQFLDLPRQRELIVQIERLQRAWPTYVAVTERDEVSQRPFWTERPSFDAFLRQPDIEEAIKELDRLCYWERGRYSLTLHVRTADPSDTFSRNWEFELTEEEARQLRQNSLNMACQVANQPTLPYATASLRYLRPGEARDA